MLAPTFAALSIAGHSDTAREPAGVESGEMRGTELVLSGRECERAVGFFLDANREREKKKLRDRSAAASSLSHPNSLACFDILLEKKS